MDAIKQFEPLWGVWKTEALIGEGSYGKVYRAVREEFGRKYYAAVKHISIPTSESQITEAISEGIADDNESVKEYFEAIAQNLINEITLMNDVKGKSNIVSYEDHLIIPKSSGVGYDIIIRMELLTGLNDILRHKQLTNKDVIKLGIDLCSALEVCVEKGIVHRDIKPSNIFVSDNGDYKLGDFGVARELEHTTSAMSKKGTYVYMAPEVYRGESANFSADIFSLGIVMYRLLNGNRAPFLPVSAKIKPGDNENALARRMSGEQIPAPAFAEEGLAQIILKATQFDRTKRYASPTEMKNDLLRLSGGTVLERTIPIIAEPTHNSVSFQKRNAADNQGTVILFPEQEMSNPQVSNAARPSQATYAPQMPVYNNTVPQQTNGTVYTTPASVNRPVQSPLPVNYQQGTANTKSNRMSAPMIALLCVLIGGLLIGFVVMIALSAGKVDTVDSGDETVSSSAEVNTSSNQEPFAIQLYGKEYMSNVSTIDLIDASITNTDELLTHFKEFTNLESINVTGCSVSNDELWEVQQQIGDVNLIWSVSICGIEVPTTTRYLHIYDESSLKEIQISNSGNYSFPFGLVGSGTGFTSYDGIENIKYVYGLEGLRVSSYSSVFDAAWLENLTKLISMTLEGKIVNTSVLGNMPQIEELSIGCSVSDHYSFLERLKNLRRLHIYNQQDDMSISLLDDLNELQDLSLEIDSSTKYIELSDVLKSKKAFTTLSMSINTKDKLDFNLLNQTSTTSLEISIMKIGSGSIDTLFSLQKINSLGIFTYPKIVSRDTVDKLKNSLSGCYITYYPWN